jgi:hypothetical protein
MIAQRFAPSLQHLVKFLGQFAVRKSTRSIFRHVSLVLMVAFTAGCGTEAQDLLSDQTDLDKTRNGCVQGSLINALTGQPVSVPTVSDAEGVFLVVRNVIIPGLSVLDNASGSETSAKPSILAGDYAACRVPLDEYYPLYVTVNGYIPFYSRVRIESTKEQVTDEDAGKGDIKKTAPTRIANVRLFPLSTLGRTFTFRVSSYGRALSGARVVMRPQNSLSPGFTPPADNAGGFLDPIAVHSGAIEATSDSTGKATFSASSVSVGVQYDYIVYPPSSGNVLVPQSSTVRIGQVTGTSDGFTQNIYMVGASANLAIVSYSTDTGVPDATGTLRIVFNRDIEWLPFPNTGTDCDGENEVTASLADTPAGVTLQSDVSGTCGSEQADVTISGNTMTITPNWSSAPSVTPPTGATIPFRIVYAFGANSIVRAVGDLSTGTNSLNLNTIPAGSRTVRFYNGD